ncbi:ATP-dependent Clp protease ATP-binding subunit CLPT1, chloroplastic-like [Cucurbita pepo subsp. pepo]|uniref:ATP-dependent Clp protease ATP-binding subunit CLPT1, chloroplastic-like n=1 Tax=Cucurbita pepo subsp. pepo TaxID=3664 RepID=UPI000C9D293E|nr:ATP-dependent Clp protease ATP-binding subunit CLPT1, chloroplastic-like [Cucurbita pepo subsp. pepo]
MAATRMNSLSLSLVPFSLPAQSNCYSLEPKTLFLPASPLIQLNLAIKRSNATHSVSKFTRRATTATVSFSLPASKPEGVSPDKLPKWSARAIKSFAMGELEARKLKYPNTGTEALLMGILIEGTNIAARFLRANGITLFKVREETVKLLGKSDMYFFSPEHPPLTESAQRALDWAVAEKLKSGQSGEITTGHLLLAIWSEESAGRKILATLGFDDEKAKEIEKTVDNDATFSYK